jgi:MFS family permease
MLMQMCSAGGAVLTAAAADHRGAAVLVGDHRAAAFGRALEVPADRVIAASGTYPPPGGVDPDPQRRLLGVSTVTVRSPRVASPSASTRRTLLLSEGAQPRRAARTAGSGHTAGESWAVPMSLRLVKGNRLAMPSPDRIMTGASRTPAIPVGDRSAAGNRLRVALAMAAVAWGANQFAPLILVYQARGQLSVASGTAIFGVYAVSLIPAVLVAGAHSGRHGQRAALRLGAWLSFAATLVMAAGCVRPEMLYLGRLLAGVASGIAFAAGTAWLAELSPADGTAARYSTIAMSAGFGLGPLVAGLAGQWLPVPTILPYLVNAVLTLVAIAVVRRTPGGAAPPRRATASRAPLIPDAARRPGFLLGVLPWTPWVFGTATVGLTILPVVYAQRAGGPTIAATGVIAAIVQLSGIAVQPFAGGARTPVLGLLLATVGLAACGLSGTAPVALVPVAAVILGASYGILLVSGLRQVERQANADDSARLVALFYVLTYVGFGGVPYLVALFAARYGYTRPLLIAALLALLTAPLAAAGARRPRSPSLRPPGRVRPCQIGPQQGHRR